MATNGVIKKGALVLIGLHGKCYYRISGRSSIGTHIGQNCGNQLTTCRRQCKVDNHSTTTAIDNRSLVDTNERGEAQLPFRRLTHARNDAIQGFLSTFFQGLRNGFSTLLASRILRDLGLRIIAFFELNERDDLFRIGFVQVDAACLDVVFGNAGHCRLPALSIG